MHGHSINRSLKYAPKTDKWSLFRSFGTVGVLRNFHQKIHFICAVFSIYWKDEVETINFDMCGSRIITAQRQHSI